MKAELIISKHFPVGEIDKRLYGSFVEHLGRCVYGGIYDPSHPTADRLGFRQDVAELVREIDVPLIRYPGGNFVSGYHWEDGTGDKAKRPRRQELAWRSIETNEVGIDEFHQWASSVNAEVNMAVNLGSRGPEDAQNLLEYCNSDRDTIYANMRRQNGFDKPFGFKIWCLGNEMDGTWQICHKTAEEYGRVAAETAKMMIKTDPSIELVVCGSSDCRKPTFGDWELTVLEHTYEFVDYLSIHQYYRNADNNTADFLGRSVHMNNFINGVVAMCDAIKAKKRSPKTINLSFDEWNIWKQRKESVEDWQVAPPILEDVYNFEDALLVGCMLMTLQNNCDRVKIACQAQLVNVIAPIMTETSGAVWKQSIFYPYMYASRYGRGVTLQPKVQCDHYVTTDNLTVPYLETSVIHNEERKEVVIFAVNRSLDEDMTLGLTMEGFENAKLAEHIELYCEDLLACNTKDQHPIAPVSKSIDQDNIRLQKHSWNMLRFTY